MPIWIVPAAPSTTPAPATTVAVGAIDHVAAALARLPIQFRKPKIEAFLRALVTPVQDVENAFQQLLTERSVDTAIGVQLDAIGFIVGQARDRSDDDEYRRLVRARIATNRSRGTFEDLIQITRLVVDDDAATIRIYRDGVATVSLLLDDVAVTDAVADILFAFLRQAKLGGVRISLEFGSTAPDGWFRWGVAGRGFSSLADPTTGGVWIDVR